MTVNSTTNKVIFTGPVTLGAPFPYSFKIFKNSDMIVEKLDTLTGLTATLTITTDYTMTGAGVETGGTVTLTANLLSTDKLILRRVLPLTQLTNLVDNENTPAATYEEVYDRDTMIDQQMQEQIDRSILQNTAATIPVTMPLPEAKKGLRWNDAGTDLINSTSNIDDIETNVAADTAAAAASAAAASISAAAASGSAIAAAASAVSAAASALTIPAPGGGGNAGKVVTVNAGGTGYELDVPGGTLTKATTPEAQAGVEDTHYMTPAKTADAIAAQAGTGNVKGDGTVSTMNLLPNADFATFWDNGTPNLNGKLPTGWAHNNNVGASINSDPGTYLRKDCGVAKLISNTTNGQHANLYYQDTTYHEYYRGRKVTFGCWVLSSTGGNKVSIYLADSAALTYSYHTGSGNWEWLTVTQTINVATTLVTVGLNVESTGSAISGWYQAPILIEGTSSFAFTPRPQLYSDTRFSVSTFSRNMSTSTNTVSYTGIGFKPKAIIMMGYSSQAATPAFSWGFGDGSNSNELSGSAGATRMTGTYGASYLGELYELAGGGVLYQLASFDDDGFSIKYTKAASPTLTAIFQVILFR